MCALSESLITGLSVVIARALLVKKMQSHLNPHLHLHIFSPHKPFLCPFYSQRWRCSCQSDFCLLGHYEDISLLSKFLATIFCECECVCVWRMFMCALCMCKSDVLVIFVNKPRHREGRVSAEELPHQFDLRACLWGIALIANW